MAEARSKYREIAADLQHQIESGRLRAGDRLPTEAELAERWKVSPSTIKEALKELRKGGRVVTRPREGTFVTPEAEPFVITLSHADVERSQAPAGLGFGGGEGKAFTAEAKRQGHTATASKPEVGVREATPRQARELRLSLDSHPQIVGRMQRRYINGSPNSLQTTYFPLTLALKAPRLLEAEDMEDGTVAYLHELGHTQSWYKDVIDARPPSADELDFFGLSKDSLAVLEHTRTAYDGDRSPFRMTVTVYAPGRNEIRIFGGNVPPEINTTE